VIPGLSIFHLIGETKPCANPECDREVAQSRMRKFSRVDLYVVKVNIKYCSRACANIGTRIKASEQKICKRKGCNSVISGFSNKKYCNECPPNRRYWCRVCNEKIVSQKDGRCGSCRNRQRTLGKRYYGESICPSCNTKFIKISGIHIYCSYRCSMYSKVCRCGNKMDHRATRCIDCRPRHVAEMYRENPELRLNQSLKVTEALIKNGRHNPHRAYSVAFSSIRRRKLIHKRAKNLCEFCGSTHKLMDIHHIDHDTKNNEPLNLILLCRSCHLNYGHTDAGRHDSPEIGTGFESIARECSQSMPLGWWEEVNDVLDHAERREDAVTKRDE